MPISSHPIRSPRHPRDAAGEIHPELVVKVVSVRLLYCEVTIFFTFQTLLFGSESISLGHPQVGQGRKP